MSAIVNRPGRGSGNATRASWSERLRLGRWFAARDRREKLLIVVGSMFLIGYVGYFWVWQPLSALRLRSLADIGRYEAITARLAAGGPDLAFGTEQTSPLPSATVITDSATAAGLLIRRLEPEGERTRMELESADFSVLIDWLALLEHDHGLRVATIELDRRPEPGMVSARISLEN